MKQRKKTRAKKRKTKARRGRAARRGTYYCLSGQYVEVVRITEGFDFDHQIQAAMLGMTFPTLSNNDPTASEWIKNYEHYYGVDFEHHLVFTRDVITGLQQRGLDDAAYVIRSNINTPLLCFPRDACVVREKKQLN